MNSNLFYAFCCILLMLIGMLFGSIINSLPELKKFIQDQNFIYGIFFLALDIVLTYLIIGRIIASTEDKKWEPLRRRVLTIANNLVLLSFNASKACLNNDINRQKLDANSIHTLHSAIGDLGQHYQKFNNDLTLYSSGMGGVTLPLLATIQSSIIQIHQRLNFLLIPFTSGGTEPENTLYFLRCKQKDYIDALNALIELHQKYPSIIKNPADSKILQIEWVENFYKSLQNSCEHFITDYDQIGNHVKELVIYDLSDLKYLGSMAPPERLHHLVFKQIHGIY